MFRSHRKGQIRITATPPGTADDESPDRKTLLDLLSFVLTGLESIRSLRTTTSTSPGGWLERWDDDDYTYLETRIPGDASELELDVSVSNGVIFARIRRRRADVLAETSPPQVDRLGRPRHLPA
jgi:hypothetical protein